MTIMYMGTLVSAIFQAGRPELTCILKLDVNPYTYMLMTSRDIYIVQYFFLLRTFTSTTHCLFKASLHPIQLGGC